MRGRGCRQAPPRSCGTELNRAAIDGSSSSSEGLSVTIVGRRRLEYRRRDGVLGRHALLQLRIVVRLIFCRRHVANRFEPSSGVEEIDPAQRRECDGFEMAPRPLPLNHLVLNSPMIDSASALS